MTHRNLLQIGDRVTFLVDTERREYRSRVLLPETKFWEFDLVSTERGLTTIVEVDYRRIHETCYDGSPWPIYTINIPAGTTSVTEDSISLVKRGNLWNYYHDEPMVFVDLQEEASFFIRIGETTEIRNPSNGWYRWTKDEAIAAIKSGSIHIYTISDMFGTPHIVARRFNNEELGTRVAKATMEGFKK